MKISTDDAFQDYKMIKVVSDGWTYWILVNTKTGAETLLRKEQQSGMQLC